MGCPKLEYNQYSNPAMRCVYNAGGRKENYARKREGEPYHLTNLKTVKSATVIRNMDFSFDAPTGNLSSRTGMITAPESFTYDKLDRLKTVKHNSTTAMSITYQPNGNISFKTGLDAYSYDATKKHGGNSVLNDKTTTTSARLGRSAPYKAINQLGAFGDEVINGGILGEIFIVYNRATGTTTVYFYIYNDPYRYWIPPPSYTVY